MADPAPIEVCSALLTKTEGATSNGAIAETATTLTADDILLLADEPAGSLRGPHWVEPPVLGEDGKVLFRRILPVPARSGGGRLTERTPAVQPRWRERVKVPHFRPSREDRGDGVEV